MSHLFKHLKRNYKQILSFALAFIVFTEPSLQSYASTSLPVVISSEASSDSYAESPDPDFDPKTYDGVPFYFDENGNKVYDEENIYKDYVKPEYLGIAETFEEYPLTTIDYRADDISTYVVGIDDAALAVLAVTLATYGVYVGHEAIKDFASTNFEPWVRTKYGNDSSVMENIQSWLAVKAGTVFAGMELFSNVVGNFIKSGQVKDSTFTMSSHPTFSTETYAPLGNPPLDKYLFSYEIPGRSEIERGYILLNSSKPDSKLSALYTTNFSTFKAVFVDKDSNGNVSSVYNGLYQRYIYYDKEGYYSGSARSSDYFDDSLYLIAHLNLPIFQNKTALSSYFEYGTSGGVVSLPEYSFPKSDSITLKKIWSGLLTNSSAYTRSNTMNVPDSSSAFLDLLNKIYASDTEDEVIENVNSVWKVQKKASKPNLSAEQSYSHLNYILSAIATYASASVTSEQIDSFIASYYGNYVDGTSARKEEQAEEIANNFVVIDGGGNNGDPDNDDKDKNKYKIAKKLAVAFSSFLLSVGITQDLLDFESNPNIAENISVSGTSSSKPSTNPDPDSGTSSDSSASNSLLKNIISAIESLPNKMVSGFTSLFQNIENAVKSLPDKSLFSGLASTVTDMARTIELLPNKLVLGFASTFSDLGTLIGSLPNAVADLMPGVLQSSLPNILADSFGLVNGFSFPAALSSIEAAIGALPAALTNPLASIQAAIDSLADALTAPLAEIQKDLANLPDSLADKLKKDETPEEPPETDDGSGLFQNILDILMLLILIVIALLILFLNCLILIFNLYQIPASTALFNENILKGLEFLKSVKIPFPGTVGIGLFDLLLACVYFVLFTSLIATLRKKIEKFHV